MSPPGRPKGEFRRAQHEGTPASTPGLHLNPRLNPRDPNVAKVELIAHALGGLREKVVFVGGCAVGLLLTDPAAAPPRVTYDVDLIAEVAALPAYHRLEREFSRLGFQRDVSPDAPICRWRYQRLEVDLMPTDPGVLGFANRWYPLAVAGADRLALPSGTTIRLIGAAAFMATKFEAFADRGHDDLLGSHDAEDIINLVDGRPELVTDVQRAPDELRQYLADRCGGLLARPDFADKLTGMIVPDEALAERVQAALRRLTLLAGLA